MADSLTLNVMSTLTERLVGAARLDARTYEEVESDPNATTQAMTVVVLSSIAGGIGTASIGGLSPRSLVTYTLAALLAWAAWAVLTYLIGTNLLPEPHTKANVGELLRTTGFAASPGLLRVIGVVPGLSQIVLIVTAFWMLATMVVAVRQALDFRSTGRAVLVCIVGWVISTALAFLLAMMLGVTVQSGL
jgi:hypothetical protein